MTIPARLSSALSDRYRVERELGQGGMATVYLAEDLKHGRKVAIKVLHPELSAVIGGDRFLAEIKVTANLQHPHILGLIDSGEADGLLYYVMPYVAGESLRVRLTREKQLPIDDAVRLSKEVASALDYAHRQGVVHRDIKPENILLQEGSALVADFGIALAVQQAGGSRMTQTGMSLGTPAYMSPEQAMGERDIGARSDVYALGAMTYEMLTGEPPFTGPNSQAIVAKVLTEPPPLLRPKRTMVPPAVEAAVLTALQKLPADRFGSAKEFAEALSSPHALTPSRPEASHPHALTPSRRGRARSVLSVVSVLSVSLAAWSFLRHRDPSAPPARLAITIPTAQRITPWAEPVAALSPDGELLVYTAEGGGTVQLYARRLSDPVGTPLQGTENGFGPVFSPDGEWIAFGSPGTGTVRKVPRQGGSSVEIPMPRGANISVIRWSGKDEFVVTLSTGRLARLSTSGTLDTIAAPDTARHEQSLDLMDVLPGGALLVIGATQPPTGRLFAIDPTSGTRTELISTPVIWAGLADGYLVWAQPDGTLYAAPFDAKRKRLTGATRPLSAQAQTTRGGRPKVALSHAGRAIAYVAVHPPTIARVGRDGLSQTLLSSPRTYHNPRVSPDGRQVSLDVTDAERDVWLVDLADTTLTRLTFEGDGHDALWMPDGRRVVFASARDNQIGAFTRSSDGTGITDSVLVEGPALSIHTVTPDGRTGIAALVTSTFAGGFDLVTVPLTGADRHSTPLLATRYSESYPALSPDGHWLAYVSDESNRPEVYVRPFPGPGGKVLVSQNGGSEPIWSRDGRELFYRGPSGGTPKLIAAEVETTKPAFRVLSRTALFEDADYETASPHPNYDVMPDGRSFIMVRLGRLAEFTYLQNWPELMRRQSASGTP